MIVKVILAVIETAVMPSVVNKTFWFFSDLRLPASCFLLVCCLLVVACDNSVSPASQSDSSRQKQASVISEKDEIPAEKPSASETKANFLIDYQNGLVTISAIDVSQLALLGQLSEKAGFGLQINYQQWVSVSLTMSNASLESVVKAILGPVPHEIVYRADVPGPARIVQLLRIGEVPSLSDSGKRAAQSMAERLKAMNQSKPKLGSESLEPEPPISKDQVLAMSDEEKIEFLPFVEPSEANLPILVDLMKNYAQPDVRIAAMASLENSDNPQAVTAIVELFADPDPKIVLAAIDSIEFAGSSSNIQSLERLLQHPSVAVQSAAREAIDFLR